MGTLAAITGSVVATAGAGMALSWLRNRSGSLAAPVMFHCSINSIGFVLAWLVQR
jgi:membrane protease YdiL (CAAX protease family)